MGKRITLVIVLIVVVAFAIWAIVAAQGSPQATTGVPTSTATASSTGYSTPGSSSGTPQTSTAPSAAAIQSAYFSTGSSTALGTYLTDPHGRTVYYYTKDATGKSNCTGICLTIWPPYGPGIKASGAQVNLPMLPAGVGTIKGNNGMLQFIYNGMPLYYYARDTAPGQTNGQGVLGTWFVIKLQ